MPVFFFLQLKKEWAEGYCDLFAQYYATVHRLETNKLRNVAKMFGHLLHTDSMAWTCLEYIQVCTHPKKERDPPSFCVICASALCEHHL